MLLFLIEKHKLFKETARRSSEGKDSRQVVIRLHVRTLSCFSHVQLFVTLCTAAHQAPLSMGFSGKNTGVDSHSLLQGNFPTQGLNLDVLHCRQILHHLNN